MQGKDTEAEKEFAIHLQRFPEATNSMNKRIEEAEKLRSQQSPQFLHALVRIPDAHRATIRWNSRERLVAREQAIVVQHAFQFRIWSSARLERGQRRANICRCGEYEKIYTSVFRAADEMRRA